MSLLHSLSKMRLVHGPSLRQRLERWIAKTHHKTIMRRLQRFRQGLERDVQPESWAALQAPMALSLADVCDALALTADERAAILGEEGEQALASILGTQITPIPRNRLER